MLTVRCIVDDVRTKYGSKDRDGVRLRVYSRE